MNYFFSYRLILFFMLAGLLAQSLFIVQPQMVAQAQSVDCSTSGPSSNAYTATVCFTAPNKGSTLTGDFAVTATVTVANAKLGVQRVAFYLNDTYLLTDYQAPYTFSLPTARWADGDYTLSVEALLRDAFTTQRANAVVHFKNGVTNPPGNNALFRPATGNPPASGAPFVVVATGDGASGEANADKVTNLISSINPNLFLYLGDVYEKGTATEFYNWYGMQGHNFGFFRAITNPTIGNHEYTSGSPQGYFTYWDNIPNYYSFDAGGWHFVSLNSNLNNAGAGVKSSQYQWLTKDLADYSNACTIAFYHHPLFNIGPEGPTTGLADVWTLLAQNDVSIVLNGHDHDYQRWVPLDGAGQPKSAGITEFVAGGGGHGLQTIQDTDNRVAYSNDANPDVFGVIKLTLHADRADFSYINTSNMTLDSGVIPCTKAGAASLDPSSASTATAPASDTSPTATTRPANPAATATANPSASIVAPSTTPSTQPTSAAAAGNDSTPTRIASPTQPIAPTTVNATPTSVNLSTTTAIPKNVASPAPPDSSIVFTPSHILALGGLAAVILIGLFMIARRHF